MNVEQMRRLDNLTMAAVMSEDCLEILQNIRRNWQRGLITHDEMVQSAIDVMSNKRIENLATKSLATKKVFRVVGWIQFPDGSSMQDENYGVTFDCRSEAIEHKRELEHANYLDMQMGMPEMYFEIVEEEE